MNAVQPQSQSQLDRVTFADSDTFGDALTFSKQRTTVSNTASNKTFFLLLDRPVVTSGCVTWEFELTACPSSSTISFGVADSRCFDPASATEVGGVGTWCLRSCGQMKQGSWPVWRKFSPFMRSGDTVSMCLDTSQGSLAYYLNGVALGFAFFELKGIPLLPLVTLSGISPGSTQVFIKGF